MDMTLLENYTDTNINLCEDTGTSLIYLAWENGHENTEHLLLDNTTNINLCKYNEAVPLFIAYENGHDSTSHFFWSMVRISI